MTRECDLERLPFQKKIEFTILRLSCLDFDEAQLTIQFWEDKKTILTILNNHNVFNYCLVRDYNYKMKNTLKRRIKPGIINVFFKKGEFNEGLFEELLTKHYGFELGKDNFLEIYLFYSFVTSKEITIVWLYDDRGFREYSYLL